MDFDSYKRAFGAHVLAAEAEQFSEAEPAEASQEDQSPIALLDGVGQLENDLGVDEWAFQGALDAGSSDLARVVDDPLVLDGSVQNDPQQPVGLGRLERADRVGQVSMPFPDVADPDLSEFVGAEGGQDEAFETVAVHLDGARSERSTVEFPPARQPLFGVLAQGHLGTLRVEADAGQVLPFYLAQERVGVG